MGNEEEGSLFNRMEERDPDRLGGKGEDAIRRR